MEKKETHQIDTVEEKNHGYLVTTLQGWIMFLPACDLKEYIPRVRQQIELTFIVGEQLKEIHYNNRLVYTNLKVESKYSEK